MALNPAVAASSIWDNYQAAASIDENGEPTGQPPSGDFAAAWAISYDNYSKAGTVAGATNTGGDKSILESFLNGVQSESGSVDGFAAALAAYWATVAVTPGSPAHGGSGVVSVVNDAAEKVADFKSAINASITDQLSTPFFQEAIENIQNMAVSKINWTVIESIPGTGPVPFVENIV